MKINIVWLRRNLRLTDNTVLMRASASDLPILLLFIFDIDIISELPANDHRISFIYNHLQKTNSLLNSLGSSIIIKKGAPHEIWNELIGDFDIHTVFTDKDYEPYGINRDKQIEALLRLSGVSMQSFNDHLIFEPGEILKKDGKPYTVFTPFKNKWLEKFDLKRITTGKSETKCNYLKTKFPFPNLSDLGFLKGNIAVPDIQYGNINDYDKNRNFPGTLGTTRSGPHLRFGTISIRNMAKIASNNHSFLNELVWREFFMHILYFFPNVITHNFKKEYDDMPWLNNEKDFSLWKNGQTGYPLVDAGMRELNSTGFMHNRVRMVAASFLCKHLLIDWRWGEAYFAGKLSDFELASNNGNWQWAAGTGCDAAPYFRIFNPEIQMKKFDNNFEYIRKWVPEFNSSAYPKPLIEHKYARTRAIATYQRALRKD